MFIEEADFGTPPEELFAAISDRPGSFLLDSALPAGGLGAWSFIGFDPFLVFRATGDEITLRRGEAIETRRGDPLAALRELLQRQGDPEAGHRKAEDRNAERRGTTAVLPFSGGAVGYFSYELCARLERIPRTSVDDAPAPDMEFGFYDGIIAYEHAAGKYYLAANPVDKAEAGTILERLKSVRKVERVAPNAFSVSAKENAQKPGISPALSLDSAETNALGTTRSTSDPELGSNYTKSQYLAAIEKVKSYIAAGDVYQVNLSQRFEALLRCPPYELYRRLRELSPAPFACYLNCGAMQVVSSSPERFLRIRDGRVETRPIKGTRPRGKTPEDDARLQGELLGSAKDRAELLMIVDLERNDLGRVCAPGSIRVDRLYELETHPTVHHLVAAVSGQLQPGGDAVDCIRAMFPGGSITGAPKIRAMQIIDEIETRRRHVYTGALGYLGFDGNCDLNIAIRTICCAGGRAHYHAGGGIVWDSDPEAEYQETLDKARAMQEALADEA